MSTEGLSRKRGGGRAPALRTGLSLDGPPLVPSPSRDPDSTDSRPLRSVELRRGASAPPLEAERIIEVGPAKFRLFGDADLVAQSRAYVYPLPAAAGPAEPVRLCCAGTGARAEGPFGVIEAGSREELLELLDYELTCQGLACLGDQAALHAACLELAVGRALVLLGVHASGKTTMAVALAQHGLRLLSDDMTLARRGPLGVRPLSRVIRVRPDSAKLLGVGAGTAGTHRIEPAPVGDPWLVPSACVEVKFSRGSSPVLTRLQPPDSTTTLLRGVFGLRDAMAERLAILAALADVTPLFRFEHGLQPAAAARALLTRLELEGAL